MPDHQQKPIAWIGSAKKDLKAMPEEVQDDIGYALDLAQHDKQADYSEKMKGDLSEVIEIRTDDESGDRTYRAAYTVKLGGTVYVLHAFQKKSKKGKATPKRELDLIRHRLRQAREHYEQEQKGRD